MAVQDAESTKRRQSAPFCTPKERELFAGNDNRVWGRAISGSFRRLESAAPSPKSLLACSVGYTVVFKAHGSQGQHLFRGPALSLLPQFPQMRKTAAHSRVLGRCSITRRHIATPLARTS